MTNQVKARKTVQRFFPAIKAKIEEEKAELYIEKGEGTPEEIDVLRTLYGYKVELVYDDSGDYHRPDKLIGYNVKW